MLRKPRDEGNSFYGSVFPLPKSAPHTNGLHKPIRKCILRQEGADKTSDETLAGAKTKPGPSGPLRPANPSLKLVTPPVSENPAELNPVLPPRMLARRCPTLET